MNDSPPAVLMRQEIFEQPDILSNLIGSATPTLETVAKRAERCAFAVLAARGSSDNASTYGKYLIESLARLTTALAAPSLFTLYQQPPRLGDALVIGVSQSGQSADVAEVVREARRQNAVTLAITNTPGSPLTEAAENVVLLNAGVERALAATKTVTAQCAVYALLTALLSGHGELRHDLTILGECARDVVAREGEIAELARQWLTAQQPTQRAAVIGRGYSYGAAQETALKLKETCFISAEPYSAADFMHGPLAMIEPGFPVLVLLNHDATLDTNVTFIERVVERGAHVIVFATAEAAPRLPRGITALSIESHASWLSPISFIIAGQLFAMHLSVAKGYDPDVSRGVTKVTVTI
jgi:glucosamine--fructose-6-phosphate aminotransferase (isomerizing)